MTLQEFMKLKTGVNDVICVRGLYFEADRFKKYVKACKDQMNVDVIFNTYDNMLEIDYMSGKARFYPIHINNYVDSNTVQWFKPVASINYCKVNETWKDVGLHKPKTGKAWEVEL